MSPTRLVAVLLAGLVLLTGCGSIYDAPLPGGAKVGKDPITVHVEFRDVLDLVPQSTVKVDDVTVGKVTAIHLKGYHADVTLSLPHGIDLPANATAEIRQTSLLGEKFVSLSPPAAAPLGKIADGDRIPLSRTGRNPEVEEVLGALSLLLNGGGVGQLKIIASELNNTLGGREEDVRSVLDQLHAFMGQLDAHKQQIVTSIDNLNRLAVQLRRQDGTIEKTLDDLPSALRSINGQRRDLVRMLRSLDELSGVGVKVIKASKASTINSLRDLAPTLTKLAEAGDDFPKSIQVFLTYPFVDAAVGNDPQVARNLHMGDFTNLSVRLDLDLGNLPTVPTLPTGLPSQVCDTLATLTARAEQAARSVVEPLPVLTTKQKKALEDRIVKRLVAEFKGQCKAPDVDRLAKLANDLVPALLDVLGLPTNIPLPSLPPIGLPTGLGVPLPGLSAAELGRVGATYDVPKGNGKRGDVLNGPVGDVAHLGYNSTIGALLLQGVVGT